MHFLVSRTALLLLACSLAVAQLTIDNPKHLNVPEDQAHILLRMSCRTVARELHLRGSSRIEFGLRLVLGEKEERYGFDEQTGVPTVFLQEWNDKKFVTAATRFAIQRSVDPQREERMIAEVLHRSRQITSVPATQLRSLAGSRDSEPAQEKQECLSGIRDASIRDVRCGSPPTHR